MYFQASRSPSANTRPMQAFAEIFRQNLSTGLLQCRLTNNRRLDFICHAGRILTGYEVYEQQATRLQDAALAQTIQESGNLPTQAIDMAPQSLRLYKAYVEACTNDKVIQTTTETVNENILQWQGLPQATFFQIHWENADALVFLGGEDKFTRQALLIGPGKSDTDIYPAIYTWPIPNCTITLFKFTTSTPGWQEFMIQLAFHRLATRLMARYKDLGGRSLVENLSNEFNRQAQKEKWDINIYSSDLVDRQLFESTEESRKAYQVMLNLVTRHMQAVIGPNLLAEAISQILMNSEAFIRQAASENALLEETLLQSIPG